MSSDTSRHVHLSAILYAILLVLSVVAVGVIGVAGISAVGLAQTGSDAALATDSADAPENGSTSGDRIELASGEIIESTVPHPSNPDNVSITAYVTARLSNETAADRSRVDFTGGPRLPTVRSIRFTSVSTDTVARTAEYGRLPPSLATPPGEPVSVMEILVPADLEQTAATITAAVDREKIAAGRSADDLAMLRYVDGEWTTLETRHVESTADEVVIEAETPGFSFFAVVADDGTVDPSTIERVVGSDTAETTADDSANDETTDDESPLLGMGGVVGSIILASLLFARRARRT